LDAVLISHLHEDYVGGFRSMTRRTFAFAAEPVEPRGVPAYVPRRSATTGRQWCSRPARGGGAEVAVLPPLPRMLFWIGPVPSGRWW
jgi:7,8-dihydropterin-6-yl-methyl-4-(beta-D-ribofuranosyl)aminobenzene 5'-phosphate synthase